MKRKGLKISTLAAVLLAVLAMVQPGRLVAQGRIDRISRVYLRLPRLLANASRPVAS